MICHILLADVLRQMVALATTSPSCHLPTLSVCQTCPLHAAIFATKFLQQILPFFDTEEIYTHACQDNLHAYIWFSIILTQNIISRMFFNICRNMLISSTSASFCALVGECQQKFLLGGAFYSPNERFSPPRPIPITQCDISGYHRWNIHFWISSLHDLFHIPGYHHLICAVHPWHYELKIQQTFVWRGIFREDQHYETYCLLSSLYLFW